MRHLQAVGQEVPDARASAEADLAGKNQDESGKTR